MFSSSFGKKELVDAENVHRTRMINEERSLRASQARGIGDSLWMELKDRSWTH